MNSNAVVLSRLLLGNCISLSGTGMSVRAARAGRLTGGILKTCTKEYFEQAELGVRNLRLNMGA